MNNIIRDHGKRGLSPHADPRTWTLESATETLLDIGAKHELDRSGLGAAYRQCDPFTQDDALPFLASIWFLDAAIAFAPLPPPPRRRWQGVYVECSYSLKHRIEEAFERNAAWHLLIPQGTAIAALIFRGVPFKRTPWNPLDARIRLNRRLLLQFRTGKPLDIPGDVPPVCAPPEWWILATFQGGEDNV